VLSDGFVLRCRHVIKNAEHDEGKLWTRDRKVHGIVPPRVEAIVVHNNRLVVGVVSRNSVNFDL